MQLIGNVSMVLQLQLVEGRRIGERHHLMIHWTNSVEVPSFFAKVLWNNQVSCTPDYWVYTVCIRVNNHNIQKISPVILLNAHMDSKHYILINLGNLWQTLETVYINDNWHQLVTTPSELLHHICRAVPFPAMAHLFKPIFVQQIL